MRLLGLRCATHPVRLRRPPLSERGRWIQPLAVFSVQASAVPSRRGVPRRGGVCCGCRGDGCCGQRGLGACAVRHTPSAFGVHPSPRGDVGYKPYQYLARGVSRPLSERGAPQGRGVSRIQWRWVLQMRLQGLRSATHPVRLRRPPLSERGRWIQPLAVSSVQAAAVPSRRGVPRRGGVCSGFNGDGCCRQRGLGAGAVRHTPSAFGGHPSPRGDVGYNPRGI